MIEPAETVLFHDGAQDFPIGCLFLGDPFGAVPGQFPEIIKTGAHIQGIALQISDGQIHGAATAMAGIPCDIALIHQQNLFLILRIKFLLHAHIIGNFRPANEMPNGALGPVRYGERRRYLLGDQLDSVMNYPFAEAVLNFVKYGKC